MIDNTFEILGKLAAAIFGLAVAIYGWQKLLRRDGREEVDATLLGRGKSTIFEQYEGVIARLEKESSRYRAEIDRQAEMLLLLQTRSVQHETELIASRKRLTEFTEMLTTVKREQRDLLEAGGLERPLLDIPTDILRP